MILEIYTDGACSQGAAHTSRDGGWGFIDMTTAHQMWGSAKNTTNNIMEMTAMIEAMKHALSFNEGGVLHIYSDSAYIVNCFKQKWYVNWQKNGWRTSKREPVKNKELWEELLANKSRLENLGMQVHLLKVKGHAYNQGNNIADALAVKGREEAANL